MFENCDKEIFAKVEADAAAWRKHDKWPIHLLPSSLSSMLPPEGLTASMGDAGELIWDPWVGAPLDDLSSPSGFV